MRLINSREALLLLAVLMPVSTQALDMSPMGYTPSTCSKTVQTSVTRAPAQSLFAKRKICFRVKSGNILDHQKFKNCIYYALCVYDLEKFQTQGNKFSYELCGDFTDADLQTIASECPKSELPHSLIITDETSGSPSRIKIRWNKGPELVRKYQEARRNLYPKKLPKKEYRELSAKISALFNAHEFQEAIDLAIATLGFDTLGYAVGFGSEPTKSLTTPSKKSVKIDPGDFLEPARLFYGIRHELEHVQQYRRIEACASSTEPPINLLDHHTREQSAYLNDILEASVSCGGDGNCTDHLQANSIVGYFEH